VCHNIEKAEGWREFPNDVQTVLKSGRFDVVSDLANLDVPRDEAIDKLAELYALDVDSADGLLGRARRDYSAAISRCVPTGINFAADKSLVAQVGQLLRDVLYRYDYERIDGRQAAVELGYTLAADDKRNALDVALGPDDPTREIDGVAAYLRAGLRINRADFETIYQDLLRQSLEVAK
jgi:hypothetical protein